MGSQRSKFVPPFAAVRANSKGLLFASLYSLYFKLLLIRITVSSDFLGRPRRFFLPPLAPLCLQPDLAPSGALQPARAPVSLPAPPAALPPYFPSSSLAACCQCGRAFLRLGHFAPFLTY